MATNAELAGAIRAAARDGAGVYIDVRLGTSRVRCLRSKAEAVARRYERDRPTPPPRYAIRPVAAWNPATHRKFCEDGELLNAVTYALNAGQPVVFAQDYRGGLPVHTVSHVRDGLFAGRITGCRGFAIVHADTGITAVYGADTKATALATLASVDAARLDEAIAGKDNGFLARTVRGVLCGNT